MQFLYDNAIMYSHIHSTCANYLTRIVQKVGAARAERAERAERTTTLAGR